MKKCSVYRTFRDIKTGTVYAAGIEADLSDDLVARVQTVLGPNVLKVLDDIPEKAPAKKPRAKKASADK